MSEENTQVEEAEGADNAETAVEDVETAAENTPDDAPTITEAETEELYEMELDEDAVYAYLVDEDDDEIGFILLDENGNEEEYYYVDESEYEIVEEAPADTDTAKVSSKADAPVITSEQVADATADINAIYKDGKAVADELKGTMDEINESLGFLGKFGKKRR